MSHQLIGFLSGCIQRYRVIHLVIRAIRHFFIAAIHGRTGRINQMLYRGMPLIVRMAAGFQNVIEANQVCFHIGIRVRNGIADTRLRTEVHYDFRLILLKDRFDHSLVCQIAFYETEIFKLLQFVQTCFLQAHIIIVVHVVQTHNLDTLHRGEQTLCKVGTNETRYTRDKNAFVFQINFCFIFHHLSLSSLSNHLAYFIAQQQACIQIAATIYTQACPRTSLFCFLLYQLSLWWVKYRAQPEAINP